MPADEGTWSAEWSSAASTPVSDQCSAAHAIKHATMIVARSTGHSLVKSIMGHVARFRSSRPRSQERISRTRAWSCFRRNRSVACSADSVASHRSAGPPPSLANDDTRTALRSGGGARPCPVHSVAEAWLPKRSETMPPGRTQSLCGQAYPDVRSPAVTRHLTRLAHGLAMTSIQAGTPAHPSSFRGLA